MGEITKNDCQGEDDATFYRALLPFEKKLYKAIGIAFQLKDFGHNVIDEIDGECFEQDVEQMDRFTAANKAALAATMEIVNPELERLRSELKQAREIMKRVDGEMFEMGHRLPCMAALRAFLKEHEDG